MSKIFRISASIMLSFVFLFPATSIAEQAASEKTAIEKVATKKAMADSSRGMILKADGDVSIVNKDGEKRAVSTSNVMVHELDTIVTRKGGKAVVRFNDGALTVLSEKSSLRVEQTNWFSHIGGKIYFTFRKVFGPSRQVKTNFSTIGVRGTTFIVYDDDSGEGVALQEGNLEIESPGEAFEIHRQKEVDDFAAFKQQARAQKENMQKEFSQYKDKITKDFVEYKKTFSLEANRVIRFDGNRVDETDFDENISKEFSSFESEAGEMLKQFRQQSKVHRENIKNQEEQE